MSLESLKQSIISKYNIHNSLHYLLESVNKKQLHAIDICLSGKNVFLTGKAGSGKSYLINILRQLIRGVQLVSSTGISARNIDGETYHALFKLGELKVYYDDYLNIATKDLDYCTKIINEVKTVIFDEVSMMDSVALELIDKLLRKIKKDTRPMGGVQCIFVGDFYQLPPVWYVPNEQDERNKSKKVPPGKHPSGLDQSFIFKSKVWDYLNLFAIELDVSQRQLNDDNFLNILESIKHRVITEDIRQILLHKQSEYFSFNENDLKDIIYLYNIKKKVHEHNETKLKELESEEKVYAAHILENNCNLSVAYILNRAESKNNVIPILTLKKGAKVMVTVNLDKPMGLVNGTLGVIIDIINGYPLIEYNYKNESLTRLITPYEYSENNYSKLNSNLTPTINWKVQQLPLMLAYAITVHKSQGLTLDRIGIDLKTACSHGLLYTALSRAKTLDSVYIKSMPLNLNVFNSNSQEEEYYKIKTEIDYFKNWLNENIDNKYNKFYD